MTRTCFPLVRYTLKIPTLPADMPRLKNLACTEKRGESGSTRKAKGSSNDSSISRCVKELSRLKGKLFQSNSISEPIVTYTPMQCPYNVFTHALLNCQQGFAIIFKKIWPPDGSGGRGVVHGRTILCRRNLRPWCSSNQSKAGTSR